MISDWHCRWVLSGVVMFCVCRTSLTLKKREYKFLSVHLKCIYIIISYNISCISILFPNFARWPCIFPSLQPHSFRLYSGFWISGSAGWSHLFETSMWSIAGRILSRELSNDRWQTTPIKTSGFFVWGSVIFFCSVIFIAFGLGLIDVDWELNSCFKNFSGWWNESRLNWKIKHAACMPHFPVRAPLPFCCKPRTMSIIFQSCSLRKRVLCMILLNSV